MGAFLAPDESQNSYGTKRVTEENRNLNYTAISN